MTQYAVVEAATGRIVSGWGAPDPEGHTGDPDWRPFPHDGLIYMPWQRSLLLGDQPTPTAELLWQAEPAWVAPLDDLVAAAVDRIDSAGDAARMLVVSKQTNTEEYRRADLQAREHAAAGYPPDDVPSCVASWAKAKHRQAWTSRDAADDIIATADRWYGLLDRIRELRLCAKEDVRHAAGAVEVAALARQFSTDLSTLMKGLQ
jgi:hypothetical protein